MEDILGFVHQIIIVMFKKIYNFFACYLFMFCSDSKFFVKEFLFLFYKCGYF